MRFSLSIQSQPHARRASAKLFLHPNQLQVDFLMPRNSTCADNIRDLRASI